MSSSLIRKSPEKGPGKRQFTQMNRACSGITGVIGTLKSNLAELEREIRADEKGKFDFDKELMKLERRKEDIKKRMKANKEWADKYDNELGPFIGSYNAMTGDLSTIYDGARRGHERGRGLLMKEFGYHPMFKRPGDTFTAIPFQPSSCK